MAGGTIGCGGTPIKAAVELIVQHIPEAKSRAAAIRNASNWATAAFGLAAHCNTVIEWLQDAQSWCPVQEKHDNTLKRELHTQQKATAEMQHKLAQAQS